MIWPFKESEQSKKVAEATKQAVQAAEELREKLRKRDERIAEMFTTIAKRAD